MKCATTVAAVTLFFLTGCGLDVPIVPTNEPADGSSSELATTPVAPPPVPAQPPLQGPTPFDPAGLASFDFDNADLLGSLFADQLALDLLMPSGPALDYTFLERLCLEGDEPDFYCHQRYGR
jgi:hypothetical protein